MADDVLTLRRLNRATLARQMLLARESVPVAEAVERLGGLQAQEARHPFTGLWSRVEGFEREHLRQALEERSLVRGTMMRATLHIVSARDYQSFRSPLQPAMNGAMKALRGRDEGLDVEALLPVARAILEEEPRNFNELRSLLQAEFPEVNERALGYAVRTQLPLVMVPTGDRWAFPSVADFAPADTWLGAAPADDPAPHGLVRRYLAAFGPATAADFQTWSGLGGAKPVLESMRGELEVFTDERGRELFDLPDAPRPDAEVPAPPRFLPEFDSLVLAHADRTRIIPEEHRSQVVTKNLRVRATFVWDGVVAGTWTVERKKKSATAVLAPFEPLPKRAIKALTDEAERLMAFAEEDAESVAVRVE